jgi:hypothetical protein
VICTPGQGHGASWSATSGSSLGPGARDLTYDDAGVRREMGRPADSIAAYLAVYGRFVGRLPGIPGMGAKGAAAVLQRPTALGTSGFALDGGRYRVSAGDAR